MKLVVQRVQKASVTRHKDGQVVGKIDKGLFVLIGIKKGDSLEMAENLVEKLSKLRIMSDENDKMNLSVLDIKASILAVSQFTLYANTSGGNRPSFVEAEDPNKAREIYEHFVSKLKEKGINVEIGSFGDYMDISVELDGPVTIVLEI